MILSREDKAVSLMQLTSRLRTTQVRMIKWGIVMTVSALATMWFTHQEETIPGIACATSFVLAGYLYMSSSDTYKTLKAERRHIYRAKTEGDD